MSKDALNSLQGITLIALLMCGGMTSPVLGQDEAADDVSGDVEDSTLDGTGADAARAANAVGDAPARPSEEPSAVDAKPAETPAPATEQTVQEPAPATPEATSTEPTPSDEAENAVTEEPTVPETPVAETAPAEAAPPVVVPETAIKGTYGGRVFGRYKVQLAMNQPTFNEGQKCYEKLYGKPQSHFSMSGDWFPVDWWINPGVMTRIGTYSVRGKAVKGATSDGAAVDCDTLVADESSRTTLLFIPIQLGLKVQMSPFRKKWVVLDFWTAGEYGWWQETRDNTTAMVRPLSLLASDQVYTNTGRKSAVSTGFSAHILLNALEERTVRSMIDTMGIGYVYLSAFMETVKSGSSQGLTFGRNVLGVGFTFETVK